eukprot:scaffold12915_cov152-Isochrysis_galbana.AAC.1
MLQAASSAARLGLADSIYTGTRLRAFRSAKPLTDRRSRCPTRLLLLLLRCQPFARCRAGASRRAPDTSHAGPVPGEGGGGGGEYNGHPYRTEN